MPLSVFFWLVFVIWVLFGAYHRWPGSPVIWGGDLLLIILIAILGWHDFGSIVTGR